jgi:hypothetical protein
MHGFEDKYHDTGIKPTPFSTNDYIYFIGSGEHTSSIDTKTNSAVYTPTNKIYIARALATEDAIRAAKIEYFTGIINAQSQWGTYSQAKPVLSAAPVTVSSFTKRFGKYYLAAACSFYGMCVGESVDGYSWTNPQTAVYTDIPPNQYGPAVVVYGNAWVPESLYSHSKAIPYTFSVWKSFGPNFMGYFYDFWFQGGNKTAVAPEKRFSFYNTKMNLYWPAGP